MKAGFYTIMAAQFFSSLADNALLIAAIRLLQELQEPEWMLPSLQQSFVVSYVILAPLVGAFADSMPKGRVMLITNAIKVVGCILMLFSVHPLLAYAVVGFGAAAYSPAKYGILTELLPPTPARRGQRLDRGNHRGLDHPRRAAGRPAGQPQRVARAAGLRHARASTPASTRRRKPPSPSSRCCISSPQSSTGSFRTPASITGCRARIPFYLIREFTHCVSLLWRDKLGQISLATTTLFWGAGATLKFIVLAWAAKALGYDLSQASYLQGVVAVGIALGAVLAAKFVSLRHAVNVLPIGTAMGLVVITMIFVTTLPVAVLLMIVIGACAGFFVVPMNALLQHRGHVLMGAGHSIAVQNFNENIGILVMVGLYALMIQQGVSVNRAVVLFGLFMSGAMLLVMWRHQYNQSKGDSLHLIADDGEHRH